MNITDYEIFKFGENKYTQFENNGRIFNLNTHPYLDVVLTDYCNANCNFCIADLIHKKLTADIDILKDKILYAIDNLNITEVLLLGGEPTMSVNLIPVIKWLKSLLVLDKIVMTTNGIRLAQDDKYRENVLSSGLTHLNISFMNVNPIKQKNVTNSKYVLSVSDIEKIYKTAKKYNIQVRLNNNIFKGNNDNLENIIEYYNRTKNITDSIKFSPLLETDTFSVVDVKTIWAKNNRLDDNDVLKLFNSIHDYYSTKHEVSIIENDLQFGFVKNTMVPLKTPIILNWNFGEYTGMMKRVVEKNQINNIKLLSNNELSLSWNRELTEYFIKTN